MPFYRSFNQNDGTVQLLYEGLPITSKMKVNDAGQLLEGLSQALAEAYQKLRDANLVETDLPRVGPSTTH
jgi:hypothetical protein